MITSRISYPPGFEALHAYAKRFGALARQIADPPHPGLSLVIVLPAYHEPDVPGALNALWQCARPRSPVEVLVVINGPADAPEIIQNQNERCRRDTLEWIRSHDDPKLRFHVLYHPDLEPRNAGVGWARKIGMDEAAWRLAAAGAENGVIANFDADCRCDPDYLAQLERHFELYPESPACSIHFEHLTADLEPLTAEAIMTYELHLRYYVAGLRFAGLPHAYHTVGSCMAVRVGAYLAQGGMNRRKAGEDFYFLQKLIALGGFSELTSTCVHPSPRVSDRVPFGTGRAMTECFLGKEFTTYPLEGFLELRQFVDAAASLRSMSQETFEVFELALPAGLRSLLQQQMWRKAIAEIQANTGSDAAFLKRFFRWFDGFRAMKCFNAMRDQIHGPRKVMPEAQRLLAQIDKVQTAPDTLEAVLARYRQLQRLPYLPSACSAIKKDGRT